MLRGYAIFIASVFVFFFNGCGSDIDLIGHTKNESSHEESQMSTVAYYGDYENNRIVVVNPEEMRLINAIETAHQKSYAAEAVKLHGDKSKSPKLYVVNRGSNAIDVIDSSSNRIVKRIDLSFYPRSIDVEKQSGLVTVSGVNKPMVAVIDAKDDRVLVETGRNEVTFPVATGHDYVSSSTLASGHPQWLDERHFVLIDRDALEIVTYRLTRSDEGSYSALRVNTIKTPSPVHDLVPPEIHGKHGHNHTIFYATAEGSPTRYPSIIKLAFDPQTGLAQLENLELKTPGLDINKSGIHHLNFIKKDQKIYVGSHEGTLFVVDYAGDTMLIRQTLQAGIGAGHTAQGKHGAAENVAVVINHKDRFITLVDTKNDTKIADIEVSQLDESMVNSAQLQSHPQYHFSKDGRYFYLFLTYEGALVKVDLQNRTVVDRLDIGGKLSMGTFLEQH